MTSDSEVKITFWVKFAGKIRLKIWTWNSWNVSRVYHIHALHTGLHVVLKCLVLMGVDPGGWGYFPPPQVKVEQIWPFFFGWCFQPVFGKFWPLSPNVDSGSTLLHMLCVCVGGGGVWGVWGVPSVLQMGKFTVMVYWIILQ